METKSILNAPKIEPSAQGGCISRWQLHLCTTPCNKSDFMQTEHMNKRCLWWREDIRMKITTVTSHLWPHCLDGSTIYSSGAGFSSKPLAEPTHICAGPLARYL